MTVTTAELPGTEANGVFVRVPEASVPPVGAMARIEVDEIAVAIANIEGELYAFDDTCTHEACSLSEGVVGEGIVICPCHKARFDLATGAVLRGPARTPIRVRSVVRQGDSVWVER